MINARSLQQLHPAGGPGPSHPTTTTTSSASTVYRPADLQPSDADPTRRRNLVVSGTAASASSMAAPSYKRQGPFSNSGSAYSNYVTAGSYGNGFPGPRILAPESSPVPATTGPARSGGGWMTAEDELGGPVPAKRSPYFAPIELSRNGGGSSSGLIGSRSSSEEDSPRPKKRLVRSDDVQPTPSSTINVTSPVDHDDADDGEAGVDESLPSVTEAMPPGLISFRTAMKGDDTPSSSVNLKLGKLNVASSGAASSESSRRPTPDVGAETQAVVGPGMMRKGKVKLDESDDEDGSGDKKMADASFSEVPGDHTSPAVAVNKKPTKRMIIPESPDTPSAPNSTAPTPSMTMPPTKRTVASSSLSPPPRPPVHRADPETVVTRLCGIYPSVSRARMRRIYDDAGGDVRKMTEILHAATAGVGMANGTASVMEGPGGVKIMRKPAVSHPPQHPSSIKRPATTATTMAGRGAAGGAEEQKRKLVRKVESEAEDSDEFSGSDEDDEPVVTEEEALHFFNTCAESEMPGITGPSSLSPSTLREEC